MITLSNDPILVIEKGLLGATFDVPYIFEVQVSKYGRMSVSAVTSVHLQEDEIPRVYLSSRNGITRENGIVRINLNQDIILEGACETNNAPDTMTWEIIPSIGAAPYQILPWTQEQYGEVFLLETASNWLTPGNTYTAHFICTDTSGGSSYSEISLAVNAPPKGPMCEACLSGKAGSECIKSGRPVVDLFKVSCNNWADPDSPLEYQFAYSGSFNGEFQEYVFDWNTISFLELIFPTGQIQIKSRVRDALGAQSEWMQDTVSRTK